MGNKEIRKWDEVKRMSIEGYEKRMSVDAVTCSESDICKNSLKTVEELVEQNGNYIDGVVNNVAPEDCSFVQRKILEIAMLQLQRKRKEQKKKHSRFYVLEGELM